MSHTAATCPDTIAERLAAVRARIGAAQAARSPGLHDVVLLAVSKTYPSQAVREAIAAGQRLFGESYLQEALPKMAALAAEAVEWHYIGAIQANKTAEIARHFAWVHSLDRLKIAERLSRQRPADLPPLDVCIQVNVSDEPQKAGVLLDELPPLAKAVATLPGLRLRGLMCLPAPEGDFKRQRLPFRRLREAQEGLLAEGLALDTLSMGMSDDLEAAVAEGATMIRIGTAIFGTRRKSREPSFTDQGAGE